MPAELTNHLWQSTLFAVVAGLLAAALRKNRAQVRYWIWLSASVKFLVPFALLMSLGSHAQLAPAAKKMIAAPAAEIAMVQMAVPFPEASVVASPRPTRDWVPVALLCVWVCGFLCLALIRFRGWLRIRAAIGASVPVEISAPVEVRSSPGLLEPGVVGVFRPVLLLPDGIEGHLTPEQLEAVLAHELCHVRRRDNLFAAIHMVVEGLFWFHPLVWWIGARLVEERERACDEEVLRLGSEPRVYAEGIVNVCKLYVESPLAWVSGVTGSDIKKRIEGIMTNRIALKLNVAKKLALAVAGIAALSLPIVVGIMNAPAARAQQGATASPPKVVAPPPQIIAQAQAQPAPRTGGRGGPVTPQPATTQGDEQARWKAYVESRLGPVQASSPKGRILIKYGMPDGLSPAGGTDPRQIWSYNYLEDFHSNVEFEFAQGKPAHINYPRPVTFEGQPGVAGEWLRSLPSEFFHGSEPPAANTIVGLPGKHASMQIYPAAYYRILTFPMDSLSSPIDVVAVVRTRPAAGAQLEGPTPKLATVRDRIVFGESPVPTGDYTANFTLDPGSYVCNLAVREQATGRMYAETINFEVQ